MDELIVLAICSALTFAIGYFVRDELYLRRTVKTLRKSVDAAKEIGTHLRKLWDQNG
jgi:hypothetical protein